MDKFQFDAVNFAFRGKNFFYKEIVGDKTELKKETMSMDLDNMKVILTQDEDYRIKKYELAVVSDAVDKVSIYYKKWEPVGVGEKGLFWLPIDFENKATKIKIEFKRGIIDPVELVIEYVDADKEKYDAFLAQKRRHELSLKMNDSYRMRQDIGLMNVYYDKCCDECVKTQIEIFVGGYDHPIMILANTEDTYFTIKDVIFGIQGDSYILSQYDKDDNLLARKTHLFK